MQGSARVKASVSWGYKVYKSCRLCSIYVKGGGVRGKERATAAMDDLHPFVYDEQYPFVFCSACKCAVLVPSTAKHLRDAHKDMDSARRLTIRKAIQELPLHTRRATGETFTVPASHLPAIPYLREAKKDGLKCNTCGWITSSTDRMRKHQRQSHNHTGRRGHAPAQLWRSGVHRQRFFRSGSSSAWFEVDGEDQELEDGVGRGGDFREWLERSSYSGKPGRTNGEGQC